MNLPQYEYPGDANARSDVEGGVYARHYAFKGGDVVLDIGAHVGFFTEWVLPKIGATGRVICVEPHPRNFDELLKRCSCFLNCTFLNAAACDTKEHHVKLRNNSHNSGGHSLYPPEQPPYHFSILVSTINVGEYCSESKIVPSFVKIDTEGSELEILNTLFAERILPSAFAIECHGRELFEPCKALLESRFYITDQEGSILFGNKP